MNKISLTNILSRIRNKYINAFTLGTTIAAISGVIQLLSLLAPWYDFDGYDFVIQKAPGYIFFLFMWLAPEYWILYIIPLNAIWAVLGLIGNYQRVIYVISDLKKYTICSSLIGFVFVLIAFLGLFVKSTESVYWGLIPTFISGLGILVGHILDIKLVNWPQRDK